MLSVARQTATFFLFWVFVVNGALAWMQPTSFSARKSASTGLSVGLDDQHEHATSNSIAASRRSFFVSVASTSALLTAAQSANAAAQRAVGSGEIECRKKGNCLEIGELDGAVGWEWGGKDRCDAADPMCGPDGKLRTTALTGKPVPPLPTPDTVFSDVAIIQVAVGRDEIGTIKIGLYGNECPGSVKELMDFLSADGLTTQDANARANFAGSFATPVSLTRGGIVNSIVPGLTVEFGVPLQSNAYARSRGLPKAGEGFVPQPKPSPSIVEKDAFVRSHDAAGLISIPAKGMGHGGTGFEQDDEIFESAFFITADATPILDKGKNRRVVGQVLDSTSMAFLERLANLPTKRGIRGVIPGQTSGPPLLKSVVRNVQIAKVTQPTNEN